MLYHYSESRDPQARHLFCPLGGLSWCKFQADIANRTENYVDKPGLPSYLRDALKPIFTRLSSPELLSKCLHGTTQNNNEALNGVIWQKCPKEVFVERQTLEVGVCSAIVNFNSGMNGVISVLRDLGMVPGHFTMAFGQKRTRFVCRIWILKLLQEVKCIVINFIMSERDLLMLKSKKVLHMRRKVLVCDTCF